MRGPRQPEPVSFGEYSTDDTTWLEMANNVGRGYGGPAGNVMQLMRNEGSGTDLSLVSMLASCSPLALQVRGMEDSPVGCGPKRAYYSMFETSGEDPGDEDLGDDCTQHVEKKRRLSFDQVRSLERTFEIENKLEPERKMQLSKELGLQPRQVAVWFQNRRARWKTKQLERDYEVLSSDFNRLKSEFDAVLKEKQELQGKMESLTGKKQTAPSNPVDLGERTKKPKTASSQKTCEASVKTERILEPNAANSKDGSPLTPACNGEMGKETVSASSEVVNADSPRTSNDSGAALLPLDNINPGSYPHIGDSRIIHMSDNLCAPMLSPQACQPISVKLEEGSSRDDSCNYSLTQLDEAERGLPWWDWP